MVPEKLHSRGTLPVAIAPGSVFVDPRLNPLALLWANTECLQLFVQSIQEG